MSIPVPTSCSNKECGAPSIKLIHHSWQKVAIDAVDGAPVFAHLVTYRCSQCGNTWGLRGYAPIEREDALIHITASAANQRTYSNRW